MKTKVHLIFILIICFVAIFNFTSCQKNIIKKPWLAKTDVNNYTSMEQIFKSSNIYKLENIIKTKNETEIRDYMTSTADKITSFIKSEYNFDISTEFINNPSGIVFLGILYLAKEKNEIHNNSISYRTNEASLGDPFDCFVGAVGALIGIADAKKIWKDITTGAVADTVLGALKTIAKRVGSILTVATTVWGFVSCLAN